MYKRILFLLFTFFSLNAFALEQRPPEFTADGYKIVNNRVDWQILNSNKIIEINNTTDFVLMVIVGVSSNFLNDPVTLKCNGKEVTITVGNSAICSVPAQQIFEISIKDEQFRWGSEGYYGFF